MRRSAYSNTASATPPASATTPPAGNGTPFSGLAVEVVPLLGGFVFRLAPDGAWSGANGVYTVTLEYGEQGTISAPKTVVIYELEGSMNMTLQKTVLGLKTSSAYDVKLKLQNAEEITLCALQFRSIQPI